MKNLKISSRYAFLWALLPLLPGSSLWYAYILVDYFKSITKDLGISSNKIVFQGLLLFIFSAVSFPAAVNIEEIDDVINLLFGVRIDISIGGSMFWMSIVGGIFVLISVLPQIIFVACKNKKKIMSILFIFCSTVLLVPILFNSDVINNIYSILVFMYFWQFGTLFSLMLLFEYYIKYKKEEMSLLK